MHISPLSEIPETLPVRSSGSKSVEDPVLHAAGPGGVVSRALTKPGRIVIGRASTADLIIDDPQVSEHHAVLKFSHTITITDAGSPAGTLLRGRPLPPGTPAELRVGDAVMLGSTVLLIRTYGRTANDVIDLCDPARFDALLEQACARAVYAHRSVGVVHIHLGAASPASVWMPLLGPWLGRGDAVTLRGTNDVQVLLEEQHREPLEHRARQIDAAFRRHAPSALTAFARTPDDGRSAEALLSSAAERAQPSFARLAEGFVFRAPACTPVLSLVARVAASDINVLLLGETGTGKDVVARIIHRASERHTRGMVSINCAALSPTLLESELFGHERGAFTGALQQKRGLLESAPGGTVFLDEIGDLPPALQSKLLRVLETREILRVGAVRPIPIDVRIIAATNRDLEREVERGHFRRDLYFRLNGVTVTMPRLSERVQDVVPLAEQFLREACQRARRTPVPRIGREAAAVLEAYAWPGNIRELRNIIERALILTTSAEISPRVLAMNPAHGPQPRPGVAPPAANPAAAPTLNERERIIAALAASGGNQTRAAKLLGIPRRTFVRQLSRHAIVRPRSP